eukprot:764218-Hanusia_phi.AAC.3
MNNGLVILSSKLQKSVTPWLSSTEAELCAEPARPMRPGTEVRMLRAILLELGLPQKDPTLILIDNSALIRVMSD